MAPKHPMSLRVSDTARAWVEDEARKADVPTAVVLRAMLSVATQHPDEVRRRVHQLRDA